MFRLVDTVRARYAVVYFVDAEDVRFYLFQKIADRPIGPVRSGEVLRIEPERRHIVGNQADYAFAFALAGRFGAVIVLTAGRIQA